MAVRPLKKYSLILITARPHFEAHAHIFFYSVTKYKCAARPKIWGKLIYFYILYSIFDIPSPEFLQRII